MQNLQATIRDSFDSAEIAWLVEFTERFLAASSEERRTWLEMSAEDLGLPKPPTNAQGLAPLSDRVRTVLCPDEK